jgi:hypothetical protein
LPGHKRVYARLRGAMPGNDAAGNSSFGVLAVAKISI